MPNTKADAQKASLAMPRQRNGHSINIQLVKQGVSVVKYCLKSLVRQEQKEVASTLTEKAISSRVRSGGNSVSNGNEAGPADRADVVIDIELHLTDIEARRHLVSIFVDAIPADAFVAAVDHVLGLPNSVAGEGIDAHPGLAYGGYFED